MGDHGARPKEARTTGYYGYTEVPTDVLRADQATVSGRVGWTGQAGTVGYRKSGGHIEQTVGNGRRTAVNAAGVAGSIVETTSRTPSVWVGVRLGLRNRRNIATSIPKLVYFGGLARRSLSGTHV